MNAMVSAKVFQFEHVPVRTVLRDDEPWFVGKDVCDALKIDNSRQALTRLDDDERDGVTINDAIGRAQRMTVISEPGVYRLVFTSRTEKAEAFKRWLAHEVLPALRRNGVYALAAEAEEEETEPLPAARDLRAWGVPLDKLMAVARAITVVKGIYGVEAARRLWESEPDLPAVRQGRMGKDAFAQGVDLFLAECIDRADPSARIAGDDLFRAYREYCLCRGLLAVERQAFAVRLGLQGVPRARNRETGGSIYLGVRLLALAGEEAACPA